MIVHAETPKTADETGPHDIPGGEGKVNRHETRVESLSNDALIKEWHWARGSHDARGNLYTTPDGKPLAWKTPNCKLAQVCEAEVIKRKLPRD